MAPIKLVIKLNGQPICKRKSEIEDHNGLEEEKSPEKVRLLDSANKVYVIKLNGRPICKRKLEIEDDNGLQEEKSSKKDYLNGRSGIITCMKTVGRHSLYNHKGRYTRLRPYVREFLEQVCRKFELYVYTMGERSYAEEVVRLIDPKCVYFENKVISKDDSTNRNQKHLDVVLGAKNTNTVIIDDTESVWKEHRDNMILINKFNYFSSRSSGGHRLNMDNDELDEDDGALKRILEVLQRVHEKFFEEFPAKTDVRPVLQAALKEASAD